MQQPKFEINRKHLKWVVWAVIGSTILFVVASLNPALNNLEDWAFGVLNATRFLMLACTVCLVIGLISYRLTTPPDLSCREDGEHLFISPCDTSSLWVINDSFDYTNATAALSRVPTGDLRRIQILIVRLEAAPSFLAEICKSLPKLAVLDVQGTKVPIDFWNDLEHCPYLHHVLCHRVLTESELKGLHMTLPEVKFHLKPKYLVLRNDLGNA